MNAAAAAVPSSRAGGRRRRVAMTRRGLVAALAAAAATPPRLAGAQSAVPMIGYLSSGSAADEVALGAAFRDGLQELGVGEGRNVVIESRWADGRYERLPAL